jgi:hypothetical protein
MKGLSTSACLQANHGRKHRLAELPKDRPDMVTDHASHSASGRTTVRRAIVRVPVASGTLYATLTHARHRRLHHLAVAAGEDLTGIRGLGGRRTWRSSSDYGGTSGYG